MQPNLAVNNKRKEKDVAKLMMTGKFDVHLLNENSMTEFDVNFEGPKDSPYEGVSKSIIFCGTCHIWKS